MTDVCWSTIKRPRNFETTNDVSLKKRIEGDDLDKCQDAIEELLQTQLDGEKFPTNLIMPVVNRYQMTNTIYVGKELQDKRIKKLLYLLWEFLPKRGPDGKFLDKLLMVCGAFDRDLKHPNPFVSGSVLRALSKTREPEVIRHLVHSIEKCLDLSHPYPRKNAALAISAIFKNFPDLIPTAPKILAEYVSKETDDDCKKTMLHALLSIDPEEAALFVSTYNVTDISSMGCNIQLKIVEVIEKTYKKDNTEQLRILSNLLKSSPSPSVRYQAARALPKFNRDAESIKSAAACFIEICAKESDNNAKIVILDDLIRLRRIRGAERVLRDSIMDILIILQSAKDLELHERILKLTLDLISPLNVGSVVTILRQEMLKMQDANIFGTAQEALKYRELLVNTVHKIAKKFPKAVIESELLDTLFRLLQSNTIGERTSRKLIYFFKVFILDNSEHRALIVKKIQDNFNSIRDNQSTHLGLLQLLGDFSKTKSEIEKTCTIIEESLGQESIVDAELRKIKLAQDGQKDDTDGDKKELASDHPKGQSSLVTADGSYAKQSAINYQTANIASSEEHPPLRAYYLKNKFDTVPVLCYTFCKLSLRYSKVESSKVARNKLSNQFLCFAAMIRRVDESSLVDTESRPLRLNKDQALVLELTIKVLLIIDEDNDESKLMKELFMNSMLDKLINVVKQLESERVAIDHNQSIKKTKTPFNQEVAISLFANRDEDLDSSNDSGIELDHEEHETTRPGLFKEIPLTGTLDPIYAYCKIDVNQFDIVLTVFLENRTSATFENVTLELSSKGEGFSNYIERPDPVVLAPRSRASVKTNIKVLSAENRRLFGRIVFDDKKEEFININDIVVNITDYIKPASIGYDDFCDIWRDCEWENKVNVKTKHTNLKEYLSHLVRGTKMCCVTADRSLNGDCYCLTANLYSKSSFGEEALVNVSVQKADISNPASLVTGNVKIRSRSQGMALSLGEKIQAVQ